MAFNIHLKRLIGTQQTYSPLSGQMDLLGDLVAHVIL